MINLCLIFAINIIVSSVCFATTFDAIDNRRKVDVLWVIDNSGSMATSQYSLAENFPIFVNVFLEKNFDFRMAVTTTDAYLAGDLWEDFYRRKDVRSRYYSDLPRQYKSRFRDGTVEQRSGYSVITNETPDIERVFRLNALQGILGYGDERPLLSVVRTFENRSNHRFLRRDSFLAVIILTDEDDRSHMGTDYRPPNSPQPVDPLEDYLEFLERLTDSGGGFRRFSISTVSIKDLICQDQLRDSFENRHVAHRLIKISQLTGGYQADLCGNFGEELLGMAKAIVKRVHKLPHPNVEETL